MITRLNPEAIIPSSDTIDDEKEFLKKKLQVYYKFYINCFYYLQIFYLIYL